MILVFTVISTNAETLKITFYQGSLIKPERLTLHDLHKTRAIKNVIGKSIKFLEKYFEPASEYLEYQITDLKLFYQFVKSNDLGELFYFDNLQKKLFQIETVNSLINKIGLDYVNDKLFIETSSNPIPYDINQIVPIGTNFLYCKNNLLIFIFFEAINLPLIKFLTDYKTPSLTKDEIRSEIFNNKILGISFSSKILKENLLKKIIIKQTTFKLQAQIYFATTQCPEVEWSEVDENSTITIPFLDSIIRDKDLEAQALQEIQSFGFYKTGSSWTSLSPATHLTFHGLQGKGWEIKINENENYHQITVLEGHLNLSVTYQEDWFEIIGDAKFEGDTISLDDILLKIKTGDKKIHLTGNRVSVIQDSWVQKLKGLLPFYNSKTKLFKLPLAMMGHLQTSDDNSISIQKDILTTDILNSINDFSKIEKVLPPTTLILELRNYQLDGLNWLAFLNKYNFGGILADDMGLGKTAQIISLLLHKKNINGQTLNLIVAPKSLLFNWEAEVNKFTNDLKIVRYYGSERTSNLNTNNADIILTTYGTIRNDGEILSNFKFDGIFLDESQSIKNHQSKTFQSIKLLNGRLKVCMTGTPIENHIGELWSQFQFALPSLLGPQTHFYHHYIKAPTEDGFKHLKAMIFPFVLRRKKEDVAKELPEKIEQTISCEMTKLQWATYENIRTTVRNSLFSKVDSQGINKSSIHILEGLLRLRQAACHTSLVLKNEQNGESGKLQSLISMVEEVISENHKALVFSQFRQMLHIIEKELKARNIPYFYLDGTTNNRGEVVTDFQKHETPCVFLISLKAGGVGLNLTAAEYVFVFDPWWNPAVEMQAIDRAHRIGQTNTVFAYRMISQNSVEEKIMLLKERKKNIADKIISTEKSLIQELTREDLEYLFS